MNFRNPADGTVTRWDLVSFTYIVVSRNFDGTYSNIWATVAEVTAPGLTGLPAPIDAVGAAFRTAVGATCSVYADPNFAFNDAAGGACDPAALVNANTAGG